MISNFTRSSSVVFDTPLLITGGCVRQCLRVILTLILVNPMTSLAFAEDSQPNYVVLPVEVRKAEVRVVEQVPPSISIPPHVLAPFVGRPLLMDEMSGIPYGRALIGVGGQSMWGQFNQFLATDLPASANGLYTTFRPDKEILDPASGETLAITAAFLGIARLDQNNDVAKLTLIESDQEVMVGDRLMPFHEASITLSTIFELPRSTAKSASAVGSPIKKITSASCSCFRLKLRFMSRKFIRSGISSRCARS